VSVRLVPAAGPHHARAFLDSNVPLYLLSADARKADVAERLVSAGGMASVQVLNEMASVLLGKWRVEWPIVREVLAAVRATCGIGVATLAVHERALDLAQRDGLGIHDATIVATALEADCSVLYSEGLQHGRVFGRRLRVVDPFR
jgi:predicted nucleic acid-binding protein